MFSAELDKLLILHVADLDEAIDKVLREWAESNGWVASEGTWNDDGEASVTPSDWVDKDGNHLASFNLEYGAGDDGLSSSGYDHFWLTRLCAEGMGQIGLRFSQYEFRKTPWKRFLQRNALKLSDTKFIVDDEPSFFLPIKIEKEALANAAEEERLETAMTPLAEAFDYIATVAPRFEELMTAMADEV